MARYKGDTAVFRAYKSRSSLHQATDIWYMNERYYDSHSASIACTRCPLRVPFEEPFSLVRQHCVLPCLLAVYAVSVWVIEFGSLSRTAGIVVSAIYADSLSFAGQLFQSTAPFVGRCIFVFLLLKLMFLAPNFDLIVKWPNRSVFEAAEYTRHRVYLVYKIWFKYTIFLV